MEDFKVSCSDCTSTSLTTLHIGDEESAYYCLSSSDNFNFFGKIREIEKEQAARRQSCLKTVEKRNTTPKIRHRGKEMSKIKKYNRRMENMNATSACNQDNTITSTSRDHQKNSSASDTATRSNSSGDQDPMEFDEDFKFLDEMINSTTDVGNIPVRVDLFDPITTIDDEMLGNTSNDSGFDSLLKCKMREEYLSPQSSSASSEPEIFHAPAVSPSLDDIAEFLNELDS